MSDGAVDGFTEGSVLASGTAGVNDGSGDGVFNGTGVGVTAAGLSSKKFTVYDTGVSRPVISTLNTSQVYANLLWDI